MGVLRRPAQLWIILLILGTYSEIGPPSLACGKRHPVRGAHTPTL